MSNSSVKPDLTRIAQQLEALEETIISKLIDRAQFRVNDTAYKRGESGFDGAADQSLLDLRLKYQERMDAQFGRFYVPEERPFNKDLPRSRRKVSLPPTCLKLDDYDVINLCGDIKNAYLELLPRMCRGGDDGQYGSSVEHDVYAFQAIARRVHFGALYVAESKFLEDIPRYRTLIRDKDTDKLLQKLTRTDIEERIIERVAEKVDQMQAFTNRQIRHVISPAVILSFYRDVIIPMTKKGEILYLLNRKD
ncbi:MAG: chorismate mutase [Fibrobacterota bacterium]